jgi:hypothetical protein
MDAASSLSAEDLASLLDCARQFAAEIDLGEDASSNMHRQTVVAAKEKDKTERVG